MTHNKNITKQVSLYELELMIPQEFAFKNSSNLTLLRCLFNNRIVFVLYFYRHKQFARYGTFRC